MKAVLLGIVLTGFLVEANFAAGEFIPQNKLVYSLEKDVTFDVVLDSSYKSYGSIYNDLDVLDEQGFFAYHIRIGPNYIPGRILAANREAVKQKKVLKCKVSGKLYWLAPVHIFSDLVDLNPLPLQFMQSRAKEESYNLLEPVFGSYEYIEDTAKRHISQRVEIYGAIPFAKPGEETDGFEVLEEGKVVAVGHLHLPRKKWGYDVIKHCLTPPLEQRRKLRLIGMVTAWERRDGIPHYTVANVSVHRGGYCLAVSNSGVGWLAKLACRQSDTNESV